MSDIVQFSYAEHFDDEETAMLKDAEYAIRGDLNQAGECLIRVGVRLIEIKEQLGRKGKEAGFVAWCGSDAFPLTYQRAMDYIAVAKQVGQWKINPGLFLSKDGPGHKALAMLSTMKDEEIKQAVYEHTTARVEAGGKVSRREVVELTKALKEAQAKAAELEDASFDAKREIEQHIQAREEAEQAAKEAEAKKKQFIDDLIAGDKQRKELLAKIQAREEELRDAEEVHRQHLEEMRQQIAAEERARPRTDAEVAESEAKLKRLKDESAKINTAINLAKSEREKVERELNDTKRQMALRDQVLSDFGKAAVRFRETCLLMTGAASALMQLPMTEDLYTQIEMVGELATTVANEMRIVTNAA